MPMKSTAEDAPQLLLENQVCFPLYSAANAVVRAYRPLLEELNLTYLQYIVLMVLWEQSSLTVKELGERLGLDSGTLTPLLKRLENKGLVARRRSEMDERSRIISVTAAGKALRNKARDIPQQLACSIGLPAARAQDLRRLCTELLEALQD
jgi:DNA-binding MarR family transcriptional regulator